MILINVKITTALEICFGIMQNLFVRSPPKSCRKFFVPSCFSETFPLKVFDHIVSARFHCLLALMFYVLSSIFVQKVLLDRHRNIHARGFIEKRKKREMYFNGSDIACGIPDCRFTVVKQRHHHCKICSWACSSVSSMIDGLVG